MSAAIGKFCLTAGVSAHPKVSKIISLIRAFNDFNEDNDPYGEHDFGSIELDGEKFFWKIDYYDSNYEYGEEPTSSNCRRLLTVMYAYEY